MLNIFKYRYFGINFMLYLQDQFNMSEQYIAWFEDERERPMRVEMSLTLSFQGRKLTGSGQDKYGTFTIDNGALEEWSISFIKRYPTHDVIYEGTASSLFPFKASGMWRLLSASYVGGRWGIGED